MNHEPSGRGAEGLPQRIESLIGEIARSADPAVRTAASELVGALLAVHREALARMLEIISTAHGVGAVQVIAADEAVGPLLVLHDLHPQDAGERIAAAIEKVRDRIADRGGDARLTECGPERVAVRARAGGGCSCGEGAVRAMIEEAVASAAPEAQLEVEFEPQTRLVPLAVSAPGAGQARDADRPASTDAKEHVRC